MRLRLSLLCVLLSITALRAQTTQPAELFTAGSNWSGTEVGDARRPNTPQAGSRPASLKISERNNAAFTANCAVASNAVELRGLVDAKGNIRAKAVRVVRGTGWDPNILEFAWTGTVMGEQVMLSFTNARNLTHTINLTIDRSAPSGKKKK